MRPSQEFRFWARRAPTGERVAAGLATVLVLALLVWLLVPGTERGATNLAADGAGSGPAPGQTSDTSGATAAPGAQGSAAASAGSAVGGGGSAAGTPSPRGATSGPGGGSGP